PSRVRQGLGGAGSKPEARWPCTNGPPHGSERWTAPLSASPRQSQQVRPCRHSCVQRQLVDPLQRSRSSPRDCPDHGQLLAQRASEPLLRIAASTPCTTRSCPGNTSPSNWGAGIVPNVLPPAQ